MQGTQVYHCILYTQRYYTIYSVSCVCLLPSKILDNPGIDQDMVKDQDSVSDTTAVQVGEEDATEELEMEIMKIFFLTNKEKLNLIVYDIICKVFKKKENKFQGHQV